MFTSEALRGRRTRESRGDRLASPCHNRFLRLQILQERRLNIEKSALDNQELAKRCSQAERDRDETQLKFEQLVQNHKLLQQSSDAEKLNHEHKHKELTDRFQKSTHDLDKMTHNYTQTFEELNELKKKFSSLQNEQTLLQRRLTESIKRHEEQTIEKEKDCLARLTQRDEVNRTTFNELRNLVNRQQRMIVKQEKEEEIDQLDHRNRFSRYKEECHAIASQSETKIKELKDKVENQRSRNEHLQAEVADIKRKEAEVRCARKTIFLAKTQEKIDLIQMDRVFAKNASRIKTLEERLRDAEDQAIQASRRVRQFCARSSVFYVGKIRLPSNWFAIDQPLLQAITIPLGKTRSNKNFKEHFAWFSLHFLDQINTPPPPY